MNWKIVYSEIKEIRVMMGNVYFNRYTSHYPLAVFINQLKGVPTNVNTKPQTK